MFFFDRVHRGMRNNKKHTAIVVLASIILSVGCKEENETPAPVVPKSPKECLVDKVTVSTPSSQDIVTYYRDANSRIDSIVDKNHVYVFTYSTNLVTAIQYRLPTRSHRIKYEMYLYDNQTPDKMITYSSSGTTFWPIFTDSYIYESGVMSKIRHEEWEDVSSSFVLATEYVMRYTEDQELISTEFYLVDSDGNPGASNVQQFDAWDGKQNPYKNQIECAMIYNNSTLWHKWAYWATGNVSTITDGLNNYDYAYTYTAYDYPDTVVESFTTYSYAYTCE